MSDTPKTLGIPPAGHGPLQVLQFNPVRGGSSGLSDAADEIAYYHSPSDDQTNRHRGLSEALSQFLLVIATEAPPGPERSTAISRAREAKFWASAAIALEEANSKADG